jgi:hypothetical protein
MTLLPCCAPESNSVRCCTRSIGGSGGRRLPQAEETPNKAKHEMTRNHFEAFGPGRDRNKQNEKAGDR